MATVQISARVDPALKKALEDYCHSRGIVMNHFIQEALLDRLEELEDIERQKVADPAAVRDSRIAIQKASAGLLSS